jgi:hypothetical protein
VVATVTVTGPAGESVPGEERQLVATARNEAEEEIPEAEIAWASSSETVASVSAAGLVTANAPGNATITASSGGKSGNFALAVVEGGQVLPEGGTVSAFGGAVTLDVPAGAVPAAVSITVSRTMLAAGDPSLVSGTGYTLGPAGTAFTAAAELAVSFAGGEGPSGVPVTDYRLHRDAGGSLQSLAGEADADARTVTAAVTELGSFAVARGPSESSCTDPEYRQFDFWVGEWNVTAAGQPPGSPPTPSDITLEESGCAVFENFGQGAGRSINVYNPGDGLWHQTFIFSIGQRFVLTGGMEGEAMVLSRSFPGAPAGSFDRWTWTQLSEGRVRQLQEVSTDGGVTVQARFDGTYVPR